MTKYTLFDHSTQRTYQMSDRPSKVNIDQFAQVADAPVGKILDCLPDILAARDLKTLISLTAKAYRDKKPVIIGMGGHVIKTGISPLLIDLMRKGVVSAIACNGSVIIHDFEISCWGQTSEDVATAIENGTFGMASDTCDTINNIIARAYEEKLGYGEAIGKYLCENDISYPQLSLAANAYKHNVPLCVHIAIGTDINHQHHSASGQAIGDCSTRDFQIFTHMVSLLDNGGVFICFGSAVIVPEVFLKALTIVRNTGQSLQNFTTAVFDMNHHYRPHTNIVTRPTQSSGQSYYFIGHHEIMLPIFLLAVRESIS